jgi:hypothetical protein
VGSLALGLSLRIVSAVWASILAGCAVGQRSLEILDPVPVLGDGATVVVWRAKQVCGSYPLNYVLIDSRPIVALAVDQHTSFRVSAGTHTVAVFHPVIDKPLLVGAAPAALPLGVVFGMHGTSITETFAAGATHSYLLRSKCVTFDESTRVSIEAITQWPDGQPPSPENYIPAGNRANTQVGPNPSLERTPTGGGAWPFRSQAVIVPSRARHLRR